MSTVLPKHFNIATKTERRKVPRVKFDLGSIKSVIFLCFHFKGSRFVRERLQMIFFFLSVRNYSICFIYSNLKACRQVVFVSNHFFLNVHALHGSKPRWKQLRMSCYRTISCKKGPLINFFTHVMVRASSKAVILLWFPGVIPGSSLQPWSCLSALSEMLPSTVCHLRGKLTVQTFGSPFLDFNSSFWIDTPR